MYSAFAKDYPSLARELVTELDIFSVSSNTPGKSTTAEAIWDTGATSSVITPSLMIRLNLIPVESEVVFGVNSQQTVDVVVVSIKLPNGVLIRNQKVAVCDIHSPPMEMLIGMDIIQRGDFSISNAGSKTLFSFVIPSIPDGVNLAEKAEALNTVKGNP
jgi:hypothetical protein